MTSKEFWELSGSEQYNVTIQKGIKIATRGNKYYHMDLYKLFDFHVEFKRLRISGGLSIFLVDHEILLKPYQDQINKHETT